MTHSTLWRVVSIGLGVVAAGLDAYGAYSLTKQIEGGSVTYLVIAAPAIAIAAVLIPFIAEGCWKEGYKIKAILWWLVFIPAAATAFYATAERWHLAKAGAEAERAAYRSAAARAKAKIEELKPEVKEAKAKADKTAGWKVCGNTCQEIRAKAARLDAELKEAEAELFKAEVAAVEESPLKAPVWLLPLALAVIAFMAVWSGFSSPPPTAGTTESKPKRKATAKRRKPSAQPVKSFPKPRLVVANDNTWLPPAA